MERHGSRGFPCLAISTSSHQSCDFNERVPISASASRSRRAPRREHDFRPSPNTCSGAAFGRVARAEVQRHEQSIHLKSKVKCEPADAAGETAARSGGACPNRDIAPTASRCCGMSPCTFLLNVAPRLARRPRRRLRLVSDSKKPATADRDGLEQIKLVAGTRNHRKLTLPPVLI